MIRILLEIIVWRNIIGKLIIHNNEMFSSGYMPFVSASQLARSRMAFWIIFLLILNMDIVFYPPPTDYFIMSFLFWNINFSVNLFSLRFYKEKGCLVGTPKNTNSCHLLSLQWLIIIDRRKTRKSSFWIEKRFRCLLHYLFIYLLFNSIFYS